MDKRASLFFLFILFALCLGISSCAKKETPDTLFTRLLGTWKKVKNATDDNNNGTIDNTEITDTPPGLTNTIEFKKDSTGVEKATYTPDLTFTWHIMGEGSIMLTYTANDTIIYRVVSVTSSNLNLTTRITAGIVGGYYNKD